MKLGKQLEFKFYEDEKKREKYQRSFSRVLWDKEKSVYKNVLGWVIAGTLNVGTLYLLAHGPEIKNSLSNLF